MPVTGPASHPHVNNPQRRPGIISPSYQKGTRGAEGTLSCASREGVYHQCGPNTRSWSRVCLGKALPEACSCQIPRGSLPAGWPRWLCPLSEVAWLAGRTHTGCKTPTLVCTTHESPAQAGRRGAEPSPGLGPARPPPPPAGIRGSRGQPVQEVT